MVSRALVPHAPKSHKRPTVEQAGSMLAKTAEGAVERYARTQAISSEHPFSHDRYFFDWPSREPTPAPDVIGCEVELSATERRGTVPRSGVLTVAWVFGDEHTEPAVRCEVRGGEVRDLELPPDGELVDAAVPLTWILWSASDYQEAE